MESLESLMTQNVMHASLCHMLGEYSAMFIASRRIHLEARSVVLEARRVLYPQ